MINVGLRIDVDTFRGTKYGVPNLCRALGEKGVQASFFFSVGPDNMGRHLFRLLRPTFFLKMLRSRASSLYGWDILLKGTLGPGPVIGKKLAQVIRASAEAGHEIGLHAWDHYAWQSRVERMSRDNIALSLKKGIDMLTQITGKAPCCSAVPAWRCTEDVLAEKAKFDFVYNSDCRGRDIFLPLVRGRKIDQPQIPVTLPTYDEIVNTNGITDINYNEHLLSLMVPDNLNVLTVHAEVEGIARLSMFKDFLKSAGNRGITFIPLGGFLQNHTPFKCDQMIRREMKGREGWVSVQAESP